MSANHLLRLRVGAVPQLHLLPHMRCWKIGVNNYNRSGEFVLFSQGYESKSNVNQITGAVGPLYYCTVNIAVEPIKAMVDTGLSATILSWNLFQANGRKTDIPRSALYWPKLHYMTTIKVLF